MSPSAPSPQTAEVAERERRSWRQWTAIVIGALLVLVYLFSLAAYAEAGQSQLETGPPAIGKDGDGVDFAFDLVAMDPAKNQMTLRMLVKPEGSFYNDQDVTFAKSLRLTVRSLTTGAVTRDIPAGTPVGGTAELNVFIDGNPNTYQFDRYQYGQPPVDAVDPIEAQLSDPAPLVSVVELGPDNQPLAVQIPIGVYPSGGLQGWKEDWQYSLSEQPVGQAAAGDTLMLQLVVKRGGGVLAFVLVVLGLMVVTAVLSALVARSVARKRRPIEATMAGWFAALLFALVPLRTNMPGAPPIGAWLDVAIFYWVELALLIAMAVFIGSWLRFRKPPTD